MQWRPGRNKEAMQDPLDGQIIGLLGSEDGRRRAFDLLVKAYNRRIYWHVRRLVNAHEDADDVVQNTFIKVWENLHRYRGEARVYTWLYRIASNEALNYLRSAARRSTLTLAEEEEQMEGSYSDAGGPEGEEIIQRLEAAIRRLPDKQRLVFNLKYYEEMKYEEMAEVTGTSVGALKASYHHAVKKIEEYLNGD
ncbi:MAG TPA: sigma-70 family RNA polymerase sigma factor [Bacteroidales bacterium]|nr:sigma-70 family RNA polymerase sigma factor [Bacteroidales bacterium]HRZ77142.1 sigma-70 family RNA polymerase sigma factor [Bacteroidales bacterium]